MFGLGTRSLVFVATHLFELVVLLFDELALYIESCDSMTEPLMCVLMSCLTNSLLKSQYFTRGIGCDLMLIRVKKSIHNEV